MTIAESLKFAIAELSAKNIKLPYFEMEILLAHTLKKPREFILAHGEKELTARQISNFKFKISCRLKGRPLAYLTGEKEFYDLKFKVNKNVLIPRPETELMVAEALRLTDNAKHITFVDVGTGSGCVIIALAKQIKNYELKITNYQFFAIDISAKALAVAKQNAKAHHVYKKIKFLHGNLLEPIINNTKYQIQNTKFIITANLPYLAPSQIKNSPTIKHEPRLALSGGKNGLELYEKLLKQINYLIHNPKYKIQNTIFVLCEFDPRQTAKIKRLIKRELPEAICQIKKDLSGFNRLAIISISQNLAPYNH